MGKVGSRGWGIGLFSSVGVMVVSKYCFVRGLSRKLYVCGSIVRREVGRWWLIWVDW